MEGKNGTLIRGRGDIVHGRGRGNLALVDLTSMEGQRKRVCGPVMQQVGPDIRWETLEEASLMVGRKEGEHLQHQSGRQHVPRQGQAGDSFIVGVVSQGIHPDETVLEVAIRVVSRRGSDEI